MNIVRDRSYLAPHVGALIALWVLGAGCVETAAEQALPAHKLAPAFASEPMASESEPAVSKEVLQAHLDFLARAPRAAGSEHLEASRTYCAQQLDELGYQVQTENLNRGAGRNTYGVKLGRRRATEQVLVSAHIDSVADCNGADDNASGVAGTLEIARVLAETAHERTLVVACWDLEEEGLVGSLSHAATAGFLLADIRVSFVLEMIGYRVSEPNSQRLPVSAELEPEFAAQFPEQYAQFVDNERRGDFVALIADAPFAVNLSGAGRHVEAFTAAAAALELPSLALEVSALQILTLPDLSRSDHAAFWSSGYSAIMITDTANLRNPNYHCANGADDLASVDVEFAALIAQATASAVASALDE